MNSVVGDHTLPGGQILQIVQGDITHESTDAIVNAANQYLQHGAGVAGAILRGGGQTIQVESDAWVQSHGTVSHAQPAWTSGGNLPARYVIHAVGPIWGDGDEDGKLSSAIKGSLKVADKLDLESLALPAISTGIFGFPMERAAEVILDAIENYFSVYTASSVKLVRVVLFDPPSVNVFMKRWQEKRWR